MEKNMLGGSALADVAGPLEDFAKKLGGEQGEQWLTAFKRFLRKEEPWPKFPIWQTIKLGTGLKTADDFRRTLKAEGCEVSNYADDLMSQPAFVHSLEGADPEQEYDIVFLTTAQLTGKKRNGTTAEVFAGAARLGLENCPAWMGPKLRLQYKSQPNGEWILVGMKPINDSDGSLNVFVVERFGPGLRLGDIWANPDDVWNPGARWVFVRPRK